VITFIPEGKTKIVKPKTETTASIISKEDLTAGNGAKHDILEGKAVWANTTTCNVFEILKACGIPLAYIKQESPTSFEAYLCRMLPWEVVVRRFADGSYIKRHKDVPKGTRFEKPLLEFYLKTTGRKWRNYDLLCDDPLAIIKGTGVYLYDPAVPFVKGTYFTRFEFSEVFEKPEDALLLGRMGEIATRSFLILEHAWSLVRLRLVDFKVEFGISSSDKLLLADVIDNDSWRLLMNGKYLDKQGYRDGEDLETTKGKYEKVADFSKSLQSSLWYMRDWGNLHLDSLVA
jgi:phosphoribosylaminoimidazole carboxylase/phosphoribosylaminoimidazole-succinocarboxamide synthase